MDDKPSTRTTDRPATSLPTTSAGVEGAIGSVPAAGGSPALLQTTVEDDVVAKIFWFNSTDRTLPIADVPYEVVLRRKSSGELIDRYDMRLRQDGSIPAEQTTTIDGCIKITQVDDRTFQIRGCDAGHHSIQHYSEGWQDANQGLSQEVLRFTRRTLYSLFVVIGLSGWLIGLYMGAATW